MSDTLSNDSQTSENHFDIVIVGGGMIGVSMLQAISQLPYRIAFIEAVSYQGDSQPSFDDRIIALSPSSQRIFQNLALWQDIEANSCPIRHIHVSDKGRFGVTRIHAQDYQLDALGYVATAKQLGAVLVNKLIQQKNVTTFQPARVVALNVSDSRYQLQVELNSAGESRRLPKSANQKQSTLLNLSCSLLIAADGDNSSIRELSGISVTRKSYHQNAIVANIRCELPHQHVAYERFTRQGPLALLPMHEKTMGLVWTHHESQVEQRMALSDSDFCQQLQVQFGRRLGEFHDVSRRVQFPLSLSYPESPVAQRLVLLGNAAHTLHPVAGQGLNLGMRDVAVLAQLLQEAAAQGRDPGDDIVLQQYAKHRISDHKTLIRFTHGLVLGFSNTLAPITMARGMGLVLADIVTPIKRYLATTSMGLSLPQPTLMLQNE